MLDLKKHKKDLAAFVSDSILSIEKYTPKMVEEAIDAYIEVTQEEEFESKQKHNMQALQDQLDEEDAHFRNQYE